MTKNKSKKNNKNRNKKNNKKNKARNGQNSNVAYPSIGAQIGHGIQKLGESVFSRIMGQGDYKLQDNLPSIQKNSLFADARNQPPSFGSNKSTFEFVHSEYVGDVTTSADGTFKATTYTVNPANAITFPWLSNMAANFESYQVEGMIFRFESTSGQSVASTNTAIGTVMGVFEYDSLDATPISKAQLLQYEGCVDARCDQSFLVGVECAPGMKVLDRLYIGAPATGADPKMYNVGDFTIATQGQPGSNVNIGELWCHYKIRMFVTKQALTQIQTLHFSNTGTTTSLTYGALTTSTQVGNLTATFTASTMTISGLTPGQYYHYEHSFVGNVPGTTASSAWSISGATTQINAYNSHTAQHWLPGAANGLSSGIANVFLATASSATITETWSSLPTGGVYSDVYVSALSAY